ncbi:hypothetical protein NBRC116589_13390 [Ruegeria sp. HU-ET01832]|uniref:hypothetical protein n=1 Tax=Ruegeria sp. HU-ET01832 TaxID=3135906 RepID=UPI003108262B
MDEKLAKRHAKKLMKDLPDYASIREWLESGKAREAQAIFEQTSNSEVPEWTLNRVAPLINPPFERPKAPIWREDLKIAFASSVTTAFEAHIFENAEAETLHFDKPERSVFLTDLQFESSSEEPGVFIMTAAHMSHHTLTRMLERELISPDNFISDVWEILMSARQLRQFFEMSKLDQDKTYDLIVPYADGAFWARMLRANAGARDYHHRAHPILSLRTFYDGSMLKSEHKERMAGYKLVKDPILSQDDLEYMKAWIRGNARLA